MPERQTAAEVEAVRGWLAEYNLTCTCIVGPHCLNSEDGVTRFKRRIDLAVALGTDLVEGGTFWPFNGRLPYSESEWRRATDLFYYRLGRAAEYAASKGVRITVETHTGLTHTGEQCLPLLERVDTDVVGITYDTGNILHRDPSAREMAEPVPGGATFLALADAARQNGICVCAGLVERDGGTVYNSAVLIGREGRLLLLHRKLNELDIGHPFYAQGDRLGVARTEFGAIGVMICADAFARGQTITRTLGYMGADVILSPCACSRRGSGRGRGAMYSPSASPHDRLLMFVSCDMGGFYRSEDGGRSGWSRG